MVFDKAYNLYQQYFVWIQHDIYFVTWQKENAFYKCLAEFDAEDETSDNILKDEVIIVQTKS